MQQASNTKLASYNTQNLNDPIIKSTLEQIARSLAEYESDNQNESIIARNANENKGEVKTAYKPLRFPRNPTVLEILSVLERRNDLQSNEESEDSQGDAEIPELKIDIFFR